MTDEAASADLRADLRARGLRLTPQRQLVLDAVLALDHATPEQILAHVGGALNLSTVYRTLELLESIGLVAHTHLGRTSAYHATSEPLHVHAVCRGCAAVADVPAAAAASLVGALEDELGFVADLRHLSVTGWCRDCQAAQER